MEEYSQVLLHLWSFSNAVDTFVNNDKGQFSASHSTSLLSSTASLLRMPRWLSQAKGVDGITNYALCEESLNIVEKYRFSELIQGK